MLQGGIVLEGNYGVYFGNSLAGKVQVMRQGLYYRIVCRCRITGAVVCRLYANCGTGKEDLGIVVPIDDGFGIDTRVPVKRFGEGEVTFRLCPKQEFAEDSFAPIFPEEPFSYIARLKDAFLEHRNGQIGIRIKTGTE